MQSSRSLMVLFTMFTALFIFGACSGKAPTAKTETSGGSGPVFIPEPTPGPSTSPSSSPSPSVSPSPSPSPSTSPYATKVEVHQADNAVIYQKDCAKFNLETRSASGALAPLAQTNIVNFDAPSQSVEGIYLSSDCTGTSTTFITMDTVTTLKTFSIKMTKNYGQVLVTVSPHPPITGGSLVFDVNKIPVLSGELYWTLNGRKLDNGYPCLDSRDKQYLVANWNLTQVGGASLDALSWSRYLGYWFDTVGRKFEEYNGLRFLHTSEALEIDYSDETKFKYNYFFQVKAVAYFDSPYDLSNPDVKCFMQIGFALKEDKTVDGNKIRVCEPISVPPTPKCN